MVAANPAASVPVVSPVDILMLIPSQVADVLLAMTLADWMQWIGAISGLAGAYVLAKNTGNSKWGWFGFLGANIFIGAFAYMIGAHALLLQQIGFTFTSLMGVWRADFVFLRRFKSGSRRAAAPRSKSMRGKKATATLADRAPRRASESSHRSQWHAL